MKKNSGKEVKTGDRLVEEAGNLSQKTDKEAIESQTNWCDEENLSKMIEQLSEREQDSPGVLPRESEPSKFRNIGWTTEEVAIDQINRLDLLPDYIQPMEADRPSVARTPRGYYCLDGWDLIELAQSSAAASVLVDVDNMAEHSDVELCIRKMALRLKTRGDAAYMEIARNSRDVYQMLLSTDERDLIVFSHGGRRDHEALSGNREDDAVEILARRIRKDRDTVLKHMLHCKYLSADAILYFVEKRAGKKFFETIQVKRRILEKELTGSRKSCLEITAEISSFMLAEFEKHIAPKTVGNRQPVVSVIQPPVASTTESNPPDDDDLDDNRDLECNQEDVEDTPNPTNINDPDKQPATVEEIKNRALDLVNRIANDLSKDITLDEFESRLRQEILTMTNLLAAINSLKNPKV